MQPFAGEWGAGVLHLEQVECGCDWGGTAGRQESLKCHGQRKVNQASRHPAVDHLGNGLGPEMEGGPVLLPQPSPRAGSTCPHSVSITLISRQVCAGPAPCHNLAWLSVVQLPPRQPLELQEASLCHLPFSRRWVESFHFLASPKQCHRKYSLPLTRWCWEQGGRAGPHHLLLAPSCFFHPVASGGCLGILAQQADGGSLCTQFPSLSVHVLDPATPGVVLRGVD